ncbi:MAG: carbohydrate kinase family protein [bacterium]
MTNFDVVTVGAATLDIVMRSEKFQVIHDSAIPGGVALCQIYGRKTEVEDVTITSGGGATNTAVSFAKKELKTACICEMGNDPASLIVYKDLQESGVETKYCVQEEKETTAVSAILVPKDGQRSIMVYRGASAMLTEKDIPWNELETRWLNVTSLGGNLKLVKKLFIWAKNNGVRVSWNPGLTEVEQSKEAQALTEYVEMLFVNREEAAVLFGSGIKNEAVAASVAPSSNALVTIITDGGRGGRVWHPSASSGRVSFAYKARVPKKVIDTTGVGDAFASGMVSGVLYGKSYEQAIEWGLRNAESILQDVGAKNKLLTLSQINR